LAGGITQSADKYAGRLATIQMGTTQPRQLQFRFMVATVHQLLTVDLDREITVMLIKQHLAAVRGPGGSYSYIRFHGGILVVTSGNWRDTGVAFRLLAATARAHSFRVDCYKSVLVLGWLHTRNFIGNQTPASGKGRCRRLKVTHLQDQQSQVLFHFRKHLFLHLVHHINLIQLFFLFSILFSDIWIANQQTTQLTQFAFYLKSAIVDFSICSIQALTIRLNKFKAFLKSQRIRPV
jgi:hypothetical protein